MCPPQLASRRTEHADDCSHQFFIEELTCLHSNHIVRGWMWGDCMASDSLHWPWGYAKWMLSCSLILPLLSSHPFKALSHVSSQHNPYSLPTPTSSPRNSTPSPVYNGATVVSPWVRKSPQCGPHVSTRCCGFFPSIGFLLVHQMRSQLEPTGATENMLPLYLFPGSCPLEDLVPNLWYRFPFLLINRPLTLFLENDPGFLCSPALHSLHSLAWMAPNLNLFFLRWNSASLKINSWTYVYKLTLEQHGSQGH